MGINQNEWSGFQINRYSTVSVYRTKWERTFEKLVSKNIIAVTAHYTGNLSRLIDI